MLDHHDPESIYLVNAGISAEPQGIFFDDFDIVLVGRGRRHVYGRSFGLEGSFSLRGWRTEDKTRCLQKLVNMRISEVPGYSWTVDAVGGAIAEGRGRLAPGSVEQPSVSTSNLLCVHGNLQQGNVHQYALASQTLLQRWEIGSVG